MMKNAVVFALMMGLGANVHATCPANLNGNWAGSAVKSLDGSAIDAQGNATSTHQVANALLTVNISGNVVTPTFYAESESGYYGGISSNSDSTPLTLSYQRTGCKGTVTQGSNTMYLIVTNSGQTIQIISYRKLSDKFGDTKLESGSSEILTLQKQ